MQKMLNTIISGVICVLLLSSCAPQPPVPEDNYYRLSPVELARSSTRLAETLSVNRFVTDGLHSERAMLFSEAASPLQLHQYHYHHWIDSPPRLLQEHLISALRSAGIAGSVVNYDSINRQGIVLNGKIRSFEHRRSADQAMVIIDLELRLDDQKGKMLLLRDYHVEHAAASSQPLDLVTGYSAALQKVYQSFIDDWKSGQH